MTAIRRAKPADAEAIATIWNPIIRDTTITFTSIPATVSGISTAIDAAQSLGEAYLVAEINGQVVGFARLQPFRGGPGYAHTQELTIHLSPSARGNGLGRALLAELENHARRSAIVSLIAAISAENDTALAFHRRQGFEQCGTVPRAGRKFDRFIDLVLMQKFL